MENVQKETNNGEIKIRFEHPVSGKMTFHDVGLSNKELLVAGGNLRIVVELGYLEDKHFFKMPTIEVNYRENVGKTGWVVDYNGEVILEKTDPSGHNTVLLLDRKKMDALKHRHTNTLVIHGDFPEEVQLSAENSFFNLIA